MLDSLILHYLTSIRMNKIRELESVFRLGKGLRTRCASFGSFDHRSFRSIFKIEWSDHMNSAQVRNRLLYTISENILWGHFHFSGPRLLGHVLHATNTSLPYHVLHCVPPTEWKKPHVDQQKTSKLKKRKFTGNLGQMNLSPSWFRPKCPSTS